jgi:hypothetical protein
MRTPPLLLPAALALLAASLSGCFWWGGPAPGGGHDPTEGDLSFPLALLGLLLIVGGVLLAVNHTKAATDRQSPPPPPQPGWQPVETPPAPEWREEGAAKGADAKPAKAPSRSAKARRRQP